MKTNIEEEREKINEIDKNIAKLLDGRLNCVKIISKIKKENNLPVFQTQREKEVIERVKKISEHPKIIANIFTNIMNESKKLQMNFMVEK